MEKLSPLWEQMPLQLEHRWPKTQTKEVVTPFRDIFNSAIETVLGPDATPVTDLFASAVQAVKETDAEKTHLEYLTATGQLDNPALLQIASAKAQLSVDLLVQLRNKALDSYNELIRMNV